MRMASFASSAMRAITLDRASAGKLTLRSMERPRACRNETLVRVAAVSLNPGEVRDALSGGTDLMPLGSDLAGTVEAPAADHSGPIVGSRVVGLVRSRGWAEYAAVPSDALAETPASVSFAEAATLPMAGLTALHALGYGGLLAAKHVLVTGATGGVGLFAVQLAHLSGACVTAAIRKPEHAALVEDFGADHVLTGDLGEASPMGPYHLVMDAIGGPASVAALSHLRARGICVVYGKAHASTEIIVESKPPMNGGARLHGFFLFEELAAEPACEGLRRLLALVKTRSLRPHVEVEEPWTEVATVARSLLDRDYIGKAVLHVLSGD